MDIIETKMAPAAIGPYSQGISFGDFIYTSGQIPLVPETGALIDGDITRQTEQAIRNLIACRNSFRVGGSLHPAS